MSGAAADTKGRSTGARSLSLLVSGFEPFPAGTSHDNSSEQALRLLDAEMCAPRGCVVTLHRVVLPVRWDTAADALRRLIAQHAPDVVLALGQGGRGVRVERIAYNVKASSDHGRVDNVGARADGQPIVAGAPATRASTLPLQAIADALRAEAVDAELSDDPGRFICNNVFYALLDALSDRRGASGGFVHLPKIERVSAEQRLVLARIAATAARTALAAVG